MQIPVKVQARMNAHFACVFSYGLDLGSLEFIVLGDDGSGYPILVRISPEGDIVTFTDLWVAWGYGEVAD